MKKPAHLAGIQMVFDTTSLVWDAHSLISDTFTSKEQEVSADNIFEILCSGDQVALRAAIQEHRKLFGDERVREAPKDRP